MSFFKETNGNITHSRLFFISFNGVFIMRKTGDKKEVEGSCIVSLIVSVSKKGNSLGRLTLKSRPLILITNCERHSKFKFSKR